jgi:hypothetical protein
VVVRGEEEEVLVKSNKVSSEFILCGLGVNQQGEQGSALLLNNDDRGFILNYFSDNETTNEAIWSPNRQQSFQTMK